MVRDLIVAVLITLAGGIAFVQGRHLPDTVALFGAGVSIAAGPLFLWRRGRQPIIPLASIYCVLMFFVLLVVNFLIFARRGLVDL